MRFAIKQQGVIRLESYAWELSLSVFLAHRIKNSADDIPAEAKTIHITIIWYRTAISGDTPDRICPVIMPGNDTSPTANNELMTGINDA